MSIVSVGTDASAAGTNGHKEDGKDEASATNTNGHVRKLSMMGLVFMTYFAVCGGPYGLEDAVGAGYPFFMLLGMILVCILLATSRRENIDICIRYLGYGRCLLH